MKFKKGDIIYHHTLLKLEGYYLVNQVDESFLAISAFPKEDSGILLTSFITFWHLYSEINDEV